MKNLISEYVKKFVDSISRTTLTKDLDLQLRQINKNIKPSLVMLGKDFRGQELASGYGIAIQAKLNQVFKKKDVCMFEILDGVFENASHQLGEVIHYVEKHFSQVTAKEAVTYRRAAVLQYIEVSALTCDYTIRVLNRVLEAEVFTMSNRVDAIDKDLPAYRVKFFDDNYAAWLDGLKMLAKPASEVIALFNAAPDVAVDEGAEDAMKAMDVITDPMRSHFISVSSNPIYYIRAYFAEREVAAIKGMEEERRIVELRLHEFKQLRDGNTPEAVVERRIEVAQERLNKLDAKLEAFYRDLMD